LYNGRPFEVFASTPKVATFEETQLISTITRMTSLALRMGTPIGEVVKQLRRVEGQSLTSIPFVVARALSHFDMDASECPECGKELIHVGGCVNCPSCGYAGCG